MPYTPPASFTAGQILTAANMNTIRTAPFGFVARASRDSNQTSISTIVDVGGVTVTFTANASRVYKTTVHVPYNEQAGTAGFQDLTITDGSNVEKGRSTQYGVVGQGRFAEVIAVESGISGSQTRKARVATSAGTMTLVASATAPAFILVEDIGPV